MEYSGIILNWPEVILTWILWQSLSQPTQAVARKREWVTFVWYLMYKMRLKVLELSPLVRLNIWITFLKCRVIILYLVQKYWEVCKVCCELFPTLLYPFPLRLLSLLFPFFFPLISSSPLPFSFCLFLPKPALFSLFPLLPLSSASPFLLFISRREGQWWW